MKVIDKNSLVIEVDIPEEYLDDVAVGSQVKVIPYFDEESFEMGVIEKLSEIVIESYGENVIKGEIKLEPPVEWMKLGMGVDVEITQPK